MRDEIAQSLDDPATTVTVPRDPVTVGGWRGAGYVIDRGDQAAYRITGGLNGGVLDFLKYSDPVYWAAQWGLEGVWLQRFACAMTFYLGRASWNWPALVSKLSPWLVRGLMFFALWLPFGTFFTIIFLLVQLALILWTIHLATSYVKNAERCFTGDNLPEDESP